MDATIELLRTDYAEQGTRGILTLPHGWACFTIELPWRDNEPYVSCVPEGDYPLRLRRSGVVERTTDGEFFTGWEVAGVPGRSYIMIHVANYPPHLEGCIGPGQNELLLEGYPAVGNSLAAFRRLMAELEGETEWRISITA